MPTRSRLQRTNLNLIITQKWFKSILFVAKVTSHTELAKVVQNSKDWDRFALGGVEFREIQLEFLLASVEIPSDVKHLGQVWQPPCKTVFRESLWKCSYPQHNWENFLSVIFVWYQVLFKWSVRGKLFFPLYHVYWPRTFNCFFRSFMWNWHEETHHTEWSCSGTGWGCRSNGLKIDKRPISLTHQMAI